MRKERTALAGWRVHAQFLAGPGPSDQTILSQGNQGADSAEASSVGPAASRVAAKRIGVQPPQDPLDRSLNKQRGCAPRKRRCGDPSPLSTDTPPEKRRCPAGTAPGHLLVEDGKCLARHPCWQEELRVSSPPALSPPATTPMMSTNLEVKPTLYAFVPDSEVDCLGTWRLHFAPTAKYSRCIDLPYIPLIRFFF